MGATSPLGHGLGTDTNPASGNAFLCRGAQFEDNANNVQQFKAGQVVPMTALIPIPHVGPMNVSIVDTTTNKAISGPLISFDVYADESLAQVSYAPSVPLRRDVIRLIRENTQLPPNNTAFSVTMPNITAGACNVAGKCVLQWFWFGTNAKQTYESCVDFVMV